MAIMSVASLQLRWHDTNGDFIFCHNFVQNGGKWKCFVACSALAIREKLLNLPFLIKIYFRFISFAGLFPLILRARAEVIKARPRNAADTARGFRLRSAGGLGGGWGQRNRWIGEPGHGRWEGKQQRRNWPHGRPQATGAWGHTRYAGRPLYRDKNRLDAESVSN